MSDVSGNISSGGGTGYPPPAGMQPPAAAPRRSGPPRWLLAIGGLLLLCCLAGAALMCLAPSVAGGLTGPFLLNGLCQTENPGIDPNTCSTWSSEVIADNPDIVNDCLASSGQDTSALYQCVLDSGVEPPQ